MTKLVDNRPFAPREMETFWRKKRKSIMVFLKKAYSRVNYHKQSLNKFKSTRKEKYKLSKLLGRQ